MILQYGNGIDLLMLMESRKKSCGSGVLPEECASLIAAGVLRALKGIHSRGVVHRDVKVRIRTSESSAKRGDAPLRIRKSGN